MSRTYYDVLGVAKSASEDEIKKAYRTKSKIWHPNKHVKTGYLKEANIEMRLIGEAYETLKDRAKRRIYDMAMKTVNTSAFHDKRLEVYEKHLEQKAREGTDPRDAELALLKEKLALNEGELANLREQLDRAGKQDPAGASEFQALQTRYDELRRELNDTRQSLITNLEQNNRLRVKFDKETEQVKKATDDLRKQLEAAKRQLDKERELTDQFSDRYDVVKRSYNELCQKLKANQDTKDLKFKKSQDANEVTEEVTEHLETLKRLAAAIIASGDLDAGAALLAQAFPSTTTAEASAQRPTAGPSSGF